MQGRCALQIKNIQPFKVRNVLQAEAQQRHKQPNSPRCCAPHRCAQASQIIGKLAGRIGTLPIPGSDIVLDRSTGEALQR